MFKHKFNGDDKGENVEPDDNGVIENIECGEEIDTNAKVILVEEDTLSSEIIDVNDEDETFDNETENANSTFIHPSLDNKITGETVLKWETCEFAATRQSSIKDHKEDKHNWCSQGYSSFKSQEKLKKLIKELQTLCQFIMLIVLCNIKLCKGY